MPLIPDPRWPHRSQGPLATDLAGQEFEVELRNNDGKMVDAKIMILYTQSNLHDLREGIVVHYFRKKRDAPKYDESKKQTMSMRKLSELLDFYIPLKSKPKKTMGSSFIPEKGKTWKSENKKQKEKKKEKKDTEVETAPQGSKETPVLEKDDFYQS